MSQSEFYFNPFDPDFRANPYPHFPALLDGPPRQLNLMMPTTLIARYDDVVTVLHDHDALHRSPPGNSRPPAHRSVRRRADDTDRRSSDSFAPAKTRQQGLHAKTSA